MNSIHTINGVPTPIITYGRNIDDDLSDVNYIVLIFTGNPGVIEFYRDFMKSLYEQLAEKNPTPIPVWGTSHAGHQIANENLLPNPTEYPDLYNLEGQIEHKLKLIRQFVPKHIKIIGIGHSVGCKIWSEVLRRDNAIERQVAECYMLFPTLERIKAAPNGQRLAPLFRYQAIILLLLLPLLYLPNFFKTMIVKLFFHLRPAEVSPCMIPGALRFLNPTSMENCANLAQAEFDEIVELDAETLEKCLDKIYYYFGTTDGWCPLAYVDDMKLKVPNMRHKICDKGLDHAFVIRSSIEMATILANLIPNVVKRA